VREQERFSKSHQKRDSFKAFSIAAASKQTCNLESIAVD
jgi:hypothetical protein